MAKRKGQIVRSTLVTPDDRQNFAIVDTNDVRGGYHIVKTAALRNAIPPDHRKEGMICRVTTENNGKGKDYILLSGFPTTGNLTDANWDEYKPGLPAGILTSHNTVEQIEYASATAQGNTKLIDELNYIETQLALKISAHNGVEDIKYNNANVSGFQTLSAKLADMDSKITAAGAMPTIEDILWGSAPTGHPADLATELKNMNDPTKIIVSLDSKNVTLQSALASLGASTPKVEDIYDAHDVPLTKLISDAANAANADNIKVKDTDGSSLVTLNNRLAALDSAITAAVPKVEDIEYKNATTEGYTKLTQKLADINDATKIMVDNGSGTNVTLATRLATLNAAASGAVQNVEDITWKVAKGGQIDTKLSKNIEDLFAAVGTLQNASVYVEDVKYKTTTTEGYTKLTDKLGAIDTKLEDMNDPDKIMVDDGKGASTTVTLTKRLNDIGTQITTAVSSAEPPQHLLYTVVNPQAGAVESLEFMTMYQCQVTEVCYYVNATATMASDLTFTVEICGPADTAFKTLRQGTFTLGASQAGKYVRTDLSGLADKIYLADNTRVRINITSIGSSDTISGLNVRVTVKKDATAGVTTNQGA